MPRAFAEDFGGFNAGFVGFATPERTGHLETGVERELRPPVYGQCV